MLGGPNHIYHGGLLQVRLRYFDVGRRRPGVPREVAALVERLTPDRVVVRLPVGLQPGSVARLDLGMRRYVNTPPYATPFP